MLLTITTTREPATDLGYLLHKHPDRLQTFATAAGPAHVFYPEATPQRCTAALLLEVDPIALVRGPAGRTNRPDYAELAQYVNDRPYAASSMLAVALKEAFRTALTGRCDARPDLAASKLPLTLHVPALRCRGPQKELARDIFAPLGWTVEAVSQPLQPAEWGDSPYLDLRLTGEQRLADALNHLYVLLPVLDDAKHYWVSPEEVDKLIRAGGGWLAAHPYRELITVRYLSYRHKLTRSALARLAEADDTEPEAFDNAVTDEDAADQEKPLAVQRREAVVKILRETNARTVGDLGCGSGVLTRDLLAEPQFTRVVAVDVSARALQLAARHLRLDQMPDRQRERLAIFQSALTYRDDRLAGLDAAVLMEVIEHLDPERLPALQRVIFGFAAPATVVVTTPNAEYNPQFEHLPPGAMRHRDHRFEWTRAQFRAWAEQTAAKHGYQASFHPVGPEHPDAGPPTQLAVFTRRGQIQVNRSHGLDASLEQLDREPAGFRDRVEQFIDGLISHYVLDGGRLVVAHAGLIERYHGRASGRVREFCLYGQTTGETDEYGLPVRYPWAQEYRGRAVVLYGHTPVPDPEWLNNTLCLDTGCVFGGRLSAFNWPERTVVSVPAARPYHPAAKPFPAASPAPNIRREPDVLDIKDVSGSRVIETAYLPRIGVREAHAAAALEVMSRFALDPRWLLYLPPTMSPVPTSTREDLLEHPEQAFAAYRSDGITSVLCEEKHMGSRAVLLVCRSSAAAQARFGVPETETCGAVWTRTGRSFFPAALTATLTGLLRAAAEDAGLFDELGTSWLLFDGELLPWNVKAAQLLRDQYAAVGAAAAAALPAAAKVLEQAAARNLPADGVQALLDRTRSRAANADAFTAAYLRYCWPTDGLTGVRLAPFQLLASEAAVYHERPHAWHLELAARLAAARPELIAPTRHIAVETGDPASVAAATRWWEDLTVGGEGMVVKPAANLTRGASGLIQPGLKVRGRDYLRLIYGPDYTEPDHLTRLRQRALSHKRSLALREYALGLEALDRVARGEPLWRVHECVFAVLALESEPVDPRL